MSNFRNDASQVAREARWTFFRFLPLFLLVTVVLSIVSFVMFSGGKIGRTVVERKVFEQSYQRSAALESQIATDEATLAEIERKLTNPNLDENTRFNLEAQASAARVRLQTTRNQQR